MIEHKIPARRDLGGFVTEVVLDNLQAVKDRWGKEGSAPPEPVTVLALIDTGASISGLTRKVIERLRLPTQSEATVKVNTPGEPIRSHIYYGTLWMKAESRLRASYVQFIESGLSGVSFDLVLGLPVLLAWDFHYRREDGGLVIRLPE